MKNLKSWDRLVRFDKVVENVGAQWQATSCWSMETIKYSGVVGEMTTKHSGIAGEEL
jgi:hypothetical protein